MCMCIYQRQCLKVGIVAVYQAWLYTQSANAAFVCVCVQVCVRVYVHMYASLNPKLRLSSEVSVDKFG